MENKKSKGKKTTFLVTEKQKQVVEKTCEKLEICCEAYLIRGLIRYKMKRCKGD